MQDLEANMKYLYYFYRGIVQKTTAYLIGSIGYCAAPIYFKFSAEIGLLWYGMPFVISGVFLIGSYGKYLVEREK